MRICHLRMHTTATMFIYGDWDTLEPIDSHVSVPITEPPSAIYRIAHV
jgi:hypothetical protein